MNPKLKRTDFVPIIGAFRYIDRYVSDVHHIENRRELSKYISKGAVTILGLTAYNIVMIGIALKGLEKLV